MMRNDERSSGQCANTKITVASWTGGRMFGGVVFGFEMQLIEETIGFLIGVVCLLVEWNCYGIMVGGCRMMIRVGDNGFG